MAVKRYSVCVECGIEGPLSGSFQEAEAATGWSGDKCPMCVEAEDLSPPKKPHCSTCTCKAPQAKIRSRGLALVCNGCKAELHDDSEIPVVRALRARGASAGWWTKGQGAWDLCPWCYLKGMPLHDYEALKRGKKALVAAGLR